VRDKTLVARLSSGEDSLLLLPIGGAERRLSQFRNFVTNRLRALVFFNTFLSIATSNLRAFPRSGQPLAD
jgi:hypothetical protein